MAGAAIHVRHQPIALIGLRFGYRSISVLVSVVAPVQSGLKAIMLAIPARCSPGQLQRQQ